MSNNGLRLGYSIGFELETENLPRSSNLGGWRDPFFNLNFHNDASIETPVREIFGRPVNTNNVPIITNGRTLGLEIVSGIINTETQEYLLGLKSLTKRLCDLGEEPKSYRAGFHVHVNTPFNLRILKSILRLGKNLEQVFYLLGCMGYDYRGKQNDSTYCRPITKWGPVCVPIGNRHFAQVFKIKDLLESDTTDEFWHRYGNMDRFAGIRYVPVRYCWLNLVPLTTQGSLEFRVFNKSLNPMYLYATIEFCKAFSLYAIESSFSSLKEEGLLKENSIFDVEGEKSRGYIVETFKKFVSKSESLKDNGQAVFFLKQILEESDINSITLPQEFIYSHLADRERVMKHWEESAYSPEIIPTRLIKKPNYVDIHNITPTSRTNRNSEEPTENNIGEQNFVPPAIAWSSVRSQDPSFRLFITPETNSVVEQNPIRNISLNDLWTPGTEEIEPDDEPEEGF